ncbi:hypothetical protein VNO77_37269 [Canavalia gladiata]|uniref:Uncharacterized protein n=1 Tax=Canavalia gladiata TaxID=3824 RepID=A0AAN9K8P3_CANGL
MTVLKSSSFLCSSDSDKPMLIDLLRYAVDDDFHINIAVIVETLAKSLFRTTNILNTWGLDLFHLKEKQKGYHTIHVKFPTTKEPMGASNLKDIHMGWFWSSSVAHLKENNPLTFGFGYTDPDCPRIMVRTDYFTSEYLFCNSHHRILFGILTPSGHFLSDSLSQDIPSKNAQVLREKCEEPHLLLFVLFLTEFARFLGSFCNFFLESEPFLLSLQSQCL